MFDDRTRILTTVCWLYERTSQKKGVTVVAFTQMAADLLTSPGRGPNEAEALIAWMGEHEHVWRSPGSSTATSTACQRKSRST